MSFVALSLGDATVNRRAELVWSAGRGFNCAMGIAGFFHLPSVLPVLLVDQASVTFPTDQLPRRYHIDENGWRILVGLTVEETFEFETLEDIPPWMRQSGHVPWQDGVPITSREKR